MNENEDYLESLLKQASVIDNPDSALSRVSDLTQKEREKEELLQAEIKDVEIDSSLLPEENNDDFGGDITSSVFDVNDISETPLDKDLFVEDSLAEDSLTEEITNEGSFDEGSLDELSLDNGSLDDLSLDNGSLDDLSLNDISLDETSPDDLSLESDEAVESIELSADSFDFPIPELSELEETISNLESSIDDTTVNNLSELFTDEPEDTNTDSINESSELNFDDLLTQLNEPDQYISDTDDSDVNRELNDDYSNEIELTMDSIDSDISEQESDPQANDEGELDDIEKLLNSGFSGEIEIPESNDDSENVTEDINTDSFSEQVSDDEVSDISSSSDIMNDDEISNLLGQINSDEQINLDSSDESIDDVETLDFSETDIDDMLNKASDVEANSAGEELEIDLEDLAAFESEFGIYDKDAIDNVDEVEISDDDVDISDILGGESKVDEDGDIMSLLNDAVLKTEEEETKQAETDADKSESEDTNKKKKKEKKKKKDKNKNTEENDLVPAKEKSKLGKFFEFLTKEEETDQGLLDGDNNSGDSLDNGTGENKEILNEVDNEEDPKSKKKKKKEKKKKGKKGEKADNPDADSDDEDADNPKKKEKKPKKEKKERKPIALDIETGKPLSKKNVVLIFVLCLSVMGGILLVIHFVPPMIQNQKARDAFFREEYEVTYQTFYGEKLNESDQALYTKSEIVLKLQHKYDAYVAYKNMGMRVEALDQLLQAVSKYDTWVIAADANDFRTQFDKVYDNIKTALIIDFGLTLDDAKSINMLPSDMEYSLKCYSIATGTEYIDPNAPMPSEFTPEDLTPESSVTELEDKLSEEGN